MSSKRRSTPALTGVRGVAALWVVIYHLQDVARTDPRFAPLTTVPLLREGFRGVDLFFLLSGFILFHVHAEDFRVPNWGATRAYAIARIGRVYPLNAAVLLMIIALCCALPGLHDPASFTVPSVLQSLLLAQRWLMPDFGAINGPSWSLSVEILGYAAFPVLAWRLARTRRPATHLLTAFLCLAALILAGRSLGFADTNITGRLALLRMFPAFAAGAALCAYARTDPPGLARHAGVIAIAAVLAITVLCGVPALAVLSIIPVAALIAALYCAIGPV